MLFISREQSPLLSLIFSNTHHQNHHFIFPFQWTNYIYHGLSQLLFWYTASWMVWQDYVSNAGLVLARCSSKYQPLYSMYYHDTSTRQVTMPLAILKKTLSIQSVLSTFCYGAITTQIMLQPARLKSCYCSIVSLFMKGTTIKKVSKRERERFF